MTDNTWNPSDDAMLYMVRNALSHAEGVLTDENIQNAIYNENAVDVSTDRIAEIRTRVEQGEYPSW